MAMSTHTDPSPADQPAPRWLLALLGVSALVMIAGAAMAWLHRGSAIVLDMVGFFCF